MEGQRLPFIDILESGRFQWAKAELSWEGRTWRRQRPEPVCGSNLWNATGAWFSEQIAKREDWNEKGGTLERSQGLEQAKLGGLNGKDGK